VYEPQMWDGRHVQHRCLEEDMPQHYQLFDSAFGPCAIAWNAHGLTRVQLPDRTHAATEACITRDDRAQCTGDPPAFATAAIHALQRYLANEGDDLHTVRLDESIVTAFNATIYRALRAVPRGETVAYGDLAKQVGSAGAARAVGMAMGRNPWPIIVPCHRVLASGRKMGGFSAPGGTATKERLLALEGVTLRDPVLPGLFGP
jgi:methylated-DNA-[protein]-cysteine S-methyltransferase